MKHSPAEPEPGRLATDETQPGGAGTKEEQPQMKHRFTRMGARGGKLAENCNV
jgi:hypothetical protein